MCMKRAILLLCTSAAFLAGLHPITAGELDPTGDDLRLLEALNPIEGVGVKSAGGASVFNGVTSELQLLSLAVVRLYQVTLSSQQDTASVCVFSPSCSQFASSAIKSRGFAVGWLMAFDRLQRCHAYAGRYYSGVLPTGKLWDPIEANYIRQGPSVLRRQQDSSVK